jgi:hypothetical protein
MSSEKDIASFEEELYESIRASDPVIEVERALEDDLEGAGIFSKSNLDCLVGSRLLNVSSAAIDRLRRFPDTPLVERELSIEEPEDWLCKYTIRLFNDSINRPNFARFPQFRSERVKKLGRCSLAEDMFLEATMSDEEKPSTLYVDPKGHVVFFKKSDGQPSTLGIKPVQVNGIRYPAGVLFNLEEEKGVPSEVIDGFRIVTSSPGNIRGIAALRFTFFAFRPEDRVRNFTPVRAGEDGEYDQCTYIDQMHYIGDLADGAPDKRTLIDAHRSLSRRSA